METEPVKFLLDTHALLWLTLGSNKLGKRARSALQRALPGQVAIAGVSLFELALLDRRGACSLQPTASVFLRELSERLLILPIDAEIAADAAHLPLPQGDPFDRVIVATARRHGLTLISRDAKIAASALTPVLW